MINYLNDNSFFTNIHIPGQFGYFTLLRWIETKHIPCFRIIHDEEADQDYLSLEQKLKLYPDIKTFSTVMNPWARAALCYEVLDNFRQQGLDNAFLKYFDFTDFESFVLSWPEAQFENTWFTLSTPQLAWLQFTDQDGNIKTVDYLMKAETLDHDFQRLQQYFRLEGQNLDHIEIYPDYQDLYSTQMRQHIEKLFYVDIEHFEYKFK